MKKKRKNSNLKIEKTIIYRDVRLMVMSWLTDNYKIKMNKNFNDKVMSDPVVKKIIKRGYKRELKINKTMGNFDVNNIAKLKKDNRTREKNSFFIVKNKGVPVWIYDLGNKKLTWPRYAQAMRNFAEYIFKAFPEDKEITHQKKMKESLKKEKFYDIYERFKIG